MSGKKIRSDTERALEEHAALPSLQTLVDSGCDRSELISYMEVAFMADDSWKTLVDMNLRAFKGSIKKIRDCAGVIDRLNRSELIYHMSIEAKDARFVGIHESPTLPVRLREYADKLDWLRHVFGPKRNIRLNAWKGWIVAVVNGKYRKTTRPRGIFPDCSCVERLPIFRECPPSMAFETYRRH
jgi:hypothetical protein